MKKDVKKLSLEMVSKVLLKSAEKEANSACLFLAYQPKTPGNMNKLRKF